MTNLDRSVQDFVNTVDLLDGRDESLIDPAATADWLHANGHTAERIDLDPQQLAELIDVREAIRAFCHRNRDDQTGIADAAAVLGTAAQRARLVADFATGGLLRPQTDGIDAVVGSMLSVLQAGLVNSSWQRLKACQGCGWVFHDGSRSRKGQWCSMTICANRSKNRSHRQRSRSQQGEHNDC